LDPNRLGLLAAGVADDPLPKRFDPPEVPPPPKSDDAWGADAAFVLFGVLPNKLGVALPEVLLAPKSDLLFWPFPPVFPPKLEAMMRA
jgi:hypothetical protein